jgi:hypothetical protein
MAKALQAFQAAAGVLDPPLEIVPIPLEGAHVIARARGSKDIAKY